MRSPVSTPDTTDLPDTTAPTTGAIAIAVDQALFALTSALVKNGTVDGKALAESLMDANRSLSTVASGGAEHDRAVLGASMALARLSQAVRDMAP
jgi:hypothetical protein